MFTQFNEEELKHFFGTQKDWGDYREGGEYFFSTKTNNGHKLFLSLSIYELLCSISLSNQHKRSIMDVELKELTKIERSDERLLFKSNDFILAEIVFAPAFKVSIFLRSQEAKDVDLSFSSLKIKYLMDYQSYHEDVEEGFYRYSYSDTEGYFADIYIKKHARSIDITLRKDGDKNDFICLYLEQFKKIATAENNLFIWSDDEHALMVQLKPNLAITWNKKLVES